MKVLCFGEILWDLFETEKKIGGAPLNFAAHLVKNGISAAIASAVGQDELGKEALDIVRGLGVETTYISKVERETGVCLVTLKDGTPDYNIKAGTAMDFIPDIKPGEKFSALYFGTLAQRSAVSRKALAKLLENEFDEVFVDINIRQHYYDREVLLRSIGAATIVKFSREEIGVLKECGICEKTAYGDICRDLCAQNKKLKTVIITLDKDGAYVYDGEKEYYSEKPQCNVVSTVGAGDSFSATFLASRLKGEEIPTALTKASKVSSFVVSCLGAVPDYPENLI